MGNIMNLLLIFVLLLSIAMLWHQVFSMSPEESLSLSAILIMIGVFGAGLTGHLKSSYYIMGVVALVGIICFLLDFSVVKREKSGLLKRFFVFFNPSIACVGLLFVYAIVAFKGAMFTYPDEISQWGAAVKYMHETGNLPYGSAFSGDEKTFSTATMFQYFWTGLRRFSEGNCLVGNFLLAMIPIYLPFSGSRWKSWKRVLGYTIAVFFTMNVMSYVKYYTLLQDYVLPLWAGGIIAWLIWSQKKEISWILLTGALFCIGAMKSMVGPLFVLIIILVVLIRQFVVFKPEKLRDIATPKNIFLLFILLFSAFSLNFLWMKMIESNLVARYSSYYAPEKSLFQIIRGIIEKVFYMMEGTVAAFPNLSYFVFALLVVLLLIILKGRFWNEKDNKLFSIVISLYAVGFILYLFVMLYAYVYVFGATDAMSVAGLERYLAYYILLGCVPIVSLFFLNEKLKNNKYLTKYFPILLILVLSFGTGGEFLYKVTSFYQDREEETDTNDGSKTIYQLRLTAKDEKDIIEKLSGKKGKIFVLGTLKMDEAKVLSYELEQRYIWSENSYRIYTRHHSDMTIYQDIIRYPDLMDVYHHEFIWCKGVEDDEKRYLRMGYLLNMSKIEEGAFYRLVRGENGITAEYLGNIQELMPEDE